MQTPATDLYEAILSTKLQFSEGLWHVDEAPVFYKNKKSLRSKGRLKNLSLNDTFYVELWGGCFKGRAYFMKVVRKHSKAGFYDCLWLTKEKELLRNLDQQVLYSEVPVSATVFVPPAKKHKNEQAPPVPEAPKKQRTTAGAPTPTRVPLAKSPTQTTARRSVSPPKSGAKGAFGGKQPRTLLTI